MRGSEKVRWARLKRMPPWATKAPRDTRAVIRFSVGKSFRVMEIDQAGHITLDLSPDVDHKFGGFMNTISVEPELVAPDVPRLNAAKDMPSFRDVVHLALGGSTAGHLRALGARKVLMMMDSLTTGPAASDPKEHARLRATYWRRFNKQLPRPPGAKGGRLSTPRGTLTSASDMRAGVRGRRSGQPLVLWSGSGWDEILFVWWACDALKRSKIAASDVWVASMTAEFKRYAARTIASPAYAEDEELLRAFTFSRRLTTAQLRMGARLWAAFTAGDLGALQNFRNHRLSAEPLGPIPESAAALVPQVRTDAGDLRLGLSSYDRRLLSLFSSGEWSTAMGRLKDRQTRDKFMSLMQGYGDLLIPARLTSWASHAPAILEHRRASTATSFLNAVEYRLTPEGQSLLTSGLRTADIAPALAIGGFVAYREPVRWACESVDGDWRFVRLRAMRSVRSK